MILSKCDILPGCILPAYGLDTGRMLRGCRKDAVGMLPGCKGGTNGMLIECGTYVMSLRWNSTENKRPSITTGPHGKAL